MSATQLSPEVFLIIPTYGQFDYARRCLHSFGEYSTDIPYTVAIIDDASPEWDTVDWQSWPPYDHFSVHFRQHDGLTRSWNEGLRMASERGATYTICGNSDILFTPGWFEPLKRGLEYVDLIGPVTNAPGHCPWQDAKKFGALNTTSDDERILISYAKMLREKPIHCMRVSRINGFFMMAKTKTWWKYAFDNENVFDPRYKLVGNEDEFQIRGLYKGMRIGFSPNSYIFHYRSVSRGLIPGVTENQGAFRRGQ